MTTIQGKHVSPEGDVPQFLTDAQMAKVSALQQASKILGATVGSQGMFVKGTVDPYILMSVADWVLDASKPDSSLPGVGPEYVDGDVSTTSVKEPTFDKSGSVTFYLRDGSSHCFLFEDTKHHGSTIEGFYTQTDRARFDFPRESVTRRVLQYNQRIDDLTVKSAARTDGDF